MDTKENFYELVIFLAMEYSLHVVFVNARCGRMVIDWPKFQLLLAIVLWWNMLFVWVIEHDIEAKGKVYPITLVGTVHLVITVPNGMETANNLEVLIICLDCLGKKVPTCYIGEIDKKSPTDEEWGN
jgi:hypothetical protein